MLPIRVLVVDDSAVIRRLLTDVIDADPDLEVVATAPNGEIAVEKVARLQPDVVTLDIEMPVMDGLATLRALRDRGLARPTVMFSTLTERGAAATLDAMALGAADYVTKPSNTGSFDEARQRVRDELLPKLRALGAPTATSLAHQQRTLPPPRRGLRCDVVAIGCSTGGPNALAELFQQLPGDLRVPLVVTQHMPPVFTGLLARRLDALSGLEVLEAEDGMALRPGRAVIAPGDHHLLLAKRGTEVVARLDQGPPESSCRPAVDPMFRSVATLFGAGALGVVLTGMGHDGQVGARWLKEAGGHVFVQDAATSVVWGMPGSIAEADLADAVLPLRELAPCILRWIAPGSPAPVTARGAGR